MIKYLFNMFILLVRIEKKIEKVTAIKKTINFELEICQRMLN
jgi:hypothetical protein